MVNTHIINKITSTGIIDIHTQFSSMNHHQITKHAVYRGNSSHNTSDNNNFAPMHTNDLDGQNHHEGGGPPFNLLITRLHYCTAYTEKTTRFAYHKHLTL